MMHGTLEKVWSGMVCAIALVAAGCALKEAEPTPPEPVRPAAVLRPAPQFKPVTGAGEGVEEAGLVTQPLPHLRSRLEIRTMLVPAGKPVTLPVEKMFQIC